MQFLDYLQLYSLPLELLGISLAMLELFAPARAERVADRILTTASDLRGFWNGVAVILTCGLLEARMWQRVLVLAGIAVVIAYMLWRGNLAGIYLGSIIWATSNALLILTYAVVFGVFLLVRRVFRARVLGIIGVLTATAGLGLELVQYVGVARTITFAPGAGGVDFAGLVLVMFYGAMLLCFLSFGWVAMKDQHSRR